jgi:hypothetical protein
MGGMCFMYGETRNAYKILVLKLQGKRPLGGPRSRLQENIKIHYRKNRL